MTQDATPLALYVHWPFCLAKCPYCDFNSHVAGNVDHSRFLAAYESEMRHLAAEYGQGRELASVFFGGGTPSLMPAWLVEGVIACAGRNFGLADGAEVTAEANPTSSESARFRDFAQAGVNRISIGVQSLEDANLAFLGREHSAAEALNALEAARSTFSRVSIDLIYAHRRHTMRNWQDELERALALGLDHYSLYQLTVERGTAFHQRSRSGEALTAHDDLSADLYEITQESMSEAGLPAYEISSHARRGEECRHNLVYWHSNDWLGTGPGAHGRVAFDGGRRGLAAYRGPASWLDRVEQCGHGIEHVTDDGPADAVAEFLMMGLRLEEGVCLRRMRSRFANADRFLDMSAIERLEDSGHIDLTRSRLRVTRPGRLVLDRILDEIIDDDFASKAGKCDAARIGAVS